MLFCFFCWCSCSAGVISSFKTINEIDQTLTSKPQSSRFDGKSLYEILAVTKSSNAQQLTQGKTRNKQNKYLTVMYPLLDIPIVSCFLNSFLAYRQLALRYHLHRNHSPTATQDFAMICKAHEILSDSSKKKKYDETGDIEDVNSMIPEDSIKYFQNVFPHITDADFEDFKVMNQLHEKRSAFDFEQKMNSNKVSANLYFCVAVCIVGKISWK